jgi:hypothetical protein
MIMPSARNYALRQAVLFYLSPINLVLTSRNGLRVPDNALDHVGVPGIVVKGSVIEAGGLRALAVEKLEP